MVWFILIKTNNILNRRNLAKDVDLNLKTRPISPETNDLYERCNDGLVLCKLINFSVPNTIDERSLNKNEKGKTKKKLHCSLVYSRIRRVKDVDYIT